LHGVALAFTYHGFGVLNYGKREFQSNGSYITTSWVVCFYIPIVPLNSKRVVLSSEVKYYRFRPKRTLVVLEKTKRNWTQVFSVYAWFGAELATLIITELQQTWWIASPGILLLALPWWLRRRALERMKAELQRRKMGFSPSLPE
jgi:hypothetical protein